MPRPAAARGWRLRAACLLAGLATLAVWIWPVEEIHDPGRPPRPLIAANPPDGSALRRPIFDPGRSPWTARGSRDAILRGDPAPPVLVVRGVRLDGNAARALIDDGTGSETWLGVGEGRSDWRLSAIAPDRITVVQRGRRFQAEFLGRPATLRPPRLDDAPLLRP